VSATASGRSVLRVRDARRLGLTAAARRIVLRVLDDIEGGELILHLPDGTVRRFGDATGPSIEAWIRDDDLFRRIATRGSIGLGEAFVAGDWTTDDLEALIELLVKNAARASQRRPYSALVRAKELRPHFQRTNGLSRSRRHIRYHYDLGNELFRLFLDDSMAYSCAVFEYETQTLEGAQQAKMRRLSDKLAIGPDDHVLEIGCGWGSFAIHAARERGARVTGVTISQEQLDLARKRVHEAGLGDRIDILLRDYRLVEGEFTKIVSIEMLEAIGERQFDTFFSACDRLLTPGGVVGLQVIAVPDQRYRRYKKTRDWIQEYVFPGSLIPSLGALSKAMTASSRLTIVNLEDIGPHYASTLREWRHRFFSRLDEVGRLGYDKRFVRLWEYYLASCEALFRSKSLQDLQLVLRRPPGSTTARG
jgi:cyclopropane-fatty-acyl-phospholipid synthase